MNIFLGELFGTLIMLLLGNGVVANVLLNKSKGQNSGWIVIATGWAFAVSIAVYISGWISGGHLNPAVTLGLVLAGKTSTTLIPYYLGGQFLGAFLGAVLVWLTYYPHWIGTDNTHHKLMCFATVPAIRRPLWNLTTEIIGTAVLLMGILGIFNTNNNIGAGMGPYIVGILVFSIGLSLGGPTGYAINPARDLAPRLAHAILPVGRKGSSDWGYAWIPIVGPIIGCVLGTLIYQYFLAPLNLL